MIQKFDIGSKIKIDEFTEFEVIKQVSLEKLLVKNIDGRRIEININDIPRIKSQPNLIADINELSENDYEEAAKRLKAIQDLDQCLNKKERKELATKNNVSIATLYRWKQTYEKFGVLSSLVPKKKNGGRGKGRLDDSLEEVVDETINNFYLQPNKPSLSQLYREIKKRCLKESLAVPDYSTVRRRVNWQNEETKVTARFGKTAGKQQFEYRGRKFEEAKHPLQIVQIDHTQMDIVLVSNLDRQPLSRPWLTLAIDLYSRMVVGYYLSFEPPGAAATGLCISSSILDKQPLLDSLEIEGDWPCWGVMNTVHTDNAKEFKGVLVHRACKEYNIELNWRALGKTYWGGTVERVFRTIKEESNLLPGATFDKVEKRVNYNSEKEAAMTLKEFEKWLVHFIVNIYHKKYHKGIEDSPYQKWQTGVLGGENELGIGIPPKFTNREKVILDFLPGVERTIQRYGVKISNIFYYSDILKTPFFKNSKEKHLFKVDPRDISKIYFWNKELMEYNEIPYRNMALPSISKWEYNKSYNYLRKLKAKNIDERSIFQAYEELSQIKDESLIKTKAKRRARTSSNVKSASKKSKSESIDLGEQLIVPKLLNFEE